MAHSKKEIYNNDIRDYEPQFNQVEKEKPSEELDKEPKDKKQEQYSETENSYSNQ